MKRITFANRIPKSNETTTIHINSTMAYENLYVCLFGVTNENAVEYIVFYISRVGPYTEYISKKPGKIIGNNTLFEMPPVTNEEDMSILKNPFYQITVTVKVRNVDGIEDCQLVRFSE